LRAKSEPNAALVGRDSRRGLHRLDRFLELLGVSVASGKRFPRPRISGRERRRFLERAGRLIELTQPAVSIAESCPGEGIFGLSLRPALPIGLQSLPILVVPVLRRA